MVKMGYVAYEQVIESESFGCFILDKAKVLHHELWLLWAWDMGPYIWGWWFYSDNLSRLRFFKALGIMSLSLHLWSKSWFEVCIFWLILSSKSAFCCWKGWGLKAMMSEPSLHFWTYFWVLSLHLGHVSWSCEAARGAKRRVRRLRAKPETI